ncbi:helicase associated domain-containing protein [Streptomyces sp. AD2-2]|nr:helicase associated domain-containing protein [Streptomyces sp. AD2-2]
MVEPALGPGLATRLHPRPHHPDLARRPAGRRKKLDQSTTRRLDTSTPQQQQLLTDLDITPEAAARRRTSRVYPTSPGLAHARTYAALHGHLACSKDTHHEGFALGDWLVQTRRRARQGGLSPGPRRPRPLVVSTLAPRLATRLPASQVQPPHRPRPLPAIQRWTKQQRTHWITLHPSQQDLLTTIGIHPG